MIALRRAVFLALMLLTTAGLVWLLWRVLAPGGWNGAKLLMLLCFAGIAPWLGVCVGNALPGFLLLVLARDPARAVLPVTGDIAAAPVTTRTALAVTVRNERMEEVLPPLRRLLDGLDAAGAGAWFALFVLSDTQDPEAAAAEAAAVAAFGAGDPRRVAYRRRADNAGFKAGNVMEFLDRHAEGFELAVMLDADSEMSAAAVLRLVRIMQAAPRMGIVQHLTVGRPAEGAFPRLFQFGMRAGMRVWATGQAWWQGDSGPYWGHNAILRIAPFRAHCRLAPLPDGQAILSHDQVEAARMRAAGWGVCVWAGEDGSQEGNPPALPEFLHRDARWLAGNLQYWHLLRLPGLWPMGLRPMGRWQLVQAMLMFAGAPLQVAVLLLAAWLAATGSGQPPRGALLALALGWSLSLYCPKLLGYAEVLVSGARAARYGGRVRFAAGAGLEIAFTLATDAVAQVHKTLAMLRLALGARPGWLPQNRQDRGVGWAEALRLFWPHTALGAVAFALLARADGAAAWALPFAGGLPLAVPLCVATAAPGVGRWLRRHGVAAVREELSALAAAVPPA